MQTARLAGEGGGRPPYHQVDCIARCHNATVRSSINKIILWMQGVHGIYKLFRKQVLPVSREVRWTTEKSCSVYLGVHHRRSAIHCGCREYMGICQLSRKQVLLGESECLASTELCTATEEGVSAQ